MTQTPPTDDTWRELVTRATGCSNPVKTETVQSLWSGFGSVFRINTGSGRLIVKHVSPPSGSVHPRGWSSDYATARKLRSYDVEILWYRQHSSLCNDYCRVPKFHGAFVDENTSVLLLEDLDDSGFPVRHDFLTQKQSLLCIDWLANFHARFIDVDSEGLWPVGTYWHLATRPDEYHALEDGKLKSTAKRIDDILSNCSNLTLVHGDAKVANFCFGFENSVAAVDFQYTGGGCGMKDLAYLIGSCFSEDECEDYAESLLSRYFDTFAKALDDNERCREIEREWRAMYPLAWTDFYRFLAGWMPTHKKINRYTRRMAEQTFDTLPDYNNK